jgi:hypothetical protein
VVLSLLSFIGDAFRDACFCFDSWGCVLFPSQEDTLKLVESKVRCGCCHHNHFSFRSHRTFPSIIMISIAGHIMNIIVMLDPLFLLTIVIWVGVDCLGSTLPTKSKIIWVIVFSVTGFLGTFVYGAFLARSRLLKIATCFIGGFFILQLIAFGYAVSHS